MLAAAIALVACGGGGSNASSNYCDELDKVQAEIVKMQKATTTSSPDAAAAQAEVQQAFDKYLTRIAKAAPSELKKDYDTYTKYISLLLELQAHPNPTAAQTKEAQTLAKDYQGAAARIQKYNQDECKIGVTTTTKAPSGGTTATTAPSTTAAK
jgi:hypothetical protein